MNKITGKARRRLKGSDIGYKEWRAMRDELNLNQTKNIMNIAKKILIEELNENTHPELVEDVIFWALKEYSEKDQKTWGRVIAGSIIDKIEVNEFLNKK